ncbi:MAG: hypothetical protein ACRCVN_02475 [Spirochaetia bacterium]
MNPANTHKIPRHNSPSFICPFCGIHAQMSWMFLEHNRPSVTTATCTACQKNSIWREDVMIYPDVGIAPPPHAMMPDTIYQYYDQARIASRQLPGVACSFLRKGIREIFILLGESGTDFNEDIDHLVQRDFGNRTFWTPMFKARLAGFELVNPDMIDSRDDLAMMQLLFYFINQVIEEAIANPKHLAEFYAKLSDPSKDPVEKSIDPDFFQRP